ncbi:PAS domain-containing protein [Mycolicibacterium sp. P9-64]|uniref:PAS domain-containing protein n=1 Tax=Mycolicibacterium sp. P9-64 TaxID=2024612 RepID=UPI001A903603|nr:PAS domain-containing protein [Mycolicibacterium sp. P9-64]
MVPAEHPQLGRDLVHSPEELAALQRLLMETASDAYYVWDAISDVYVYSPQFAAILGMRHDQLPHKDSDVTALYHPDDVDAVMASWNAAWPDTNGWQAEYRLRRPDGSYATLDERACFVRDQDGTAVRLIGMVRDVTLERQAVEALRDSRDLYEALFRQVDNPALRLAPDGIVIDANGPALEWFGVTPDELGEVSLQKFVSPEVFAEFLSRMSQGRSLVHVEIVLSHGDELRHLLASTTRIHTREGDSAFLLGTDVTESRRLQHDLEASDVELRARTAALDDMNTALTVLLEQRDRDRKSLEARVADNIRELVLPVLEGVRRSLAPAPDAIRLDGVRDTLEKVTRELLPGQAEQPYYTHLTRRENEIASLIRAGKTTHEIAEALVLAPATVTSHRRNIRRKLGLAGPHQRLSASLARSGIDGR